MGLSDRLSETQRLLALRARGVRVPLFAGVSISADSDLGSEARVARDASMFASTIGRLSYIGRGTRLSFADVGAFCAIAWNVSIGAPDHPLDRATTHGFPYLAGDGGFVTATPPPVALARLGNDVWVGANAIVLPGVTVGHGAVIAAAAVVARDVPPYTIVAGVPAREQRLRIPEPLVERMLTVAWWEWPRPLLQRNLSLFQRPLDEYVVRQLEEVMRQRC
jgi:acetyltransferase-like isoleucine patch superfamily enzyme